MPLIFWTLSNIRDDNIDRGSSIFCFNVKQETKLYRKLTIVNLNFNFMELLRAFGGFRAKASIENLTQ